MKRYRQAVSALVVRPANVCAPAQADEAACRTVHEILLVHKPRKNDVWQLPQGGIEQGETVEQAAIRELKEETGLQFSAPAYVSDRTYTYDFSPEFVARHNPYNHGQSLRFVLLKADASATVTVDPRELDGHAWVLPQQLGLYIKRPQYLQVLKEFWEECQEYLQVR